MILMLPALVSDFNPVRGACVGNYSCKHRLFFIQLAGPPVIEIQSGAASLCFKEDLFFRG